MGKLGVSTVFAQDSRWNQDRHDIAGVRQAAPDSHWLIGRSLGRLGKCQYLQERYQESEAVLLDALETVESIEGLDAAKRATMIRFMLDLYTRWGKPEQAEIWRARLASAESDG